jgi:hypothetical protein
MKLNFLLPVVFLLLSSFLNGQTYPLAKVHAYAQAMLSGVKPQGIIEEGGKEIKTNSGAKFNYFIYAEYRPQLKFTINAIWIKGQAYGVKTKTVIETPVVLDQSATGTGGQKTEMVPATKYRVLQLFPSGLVNTRETPARIKKLVETSDLVIRYLWKGKTWYYALPKINLLEPFAGV